MKNNETPLADMKTNEEPKPDFEEEESGYRDCQNCGREFDEIDYDYQICHHCGFDQKWWQGREQWGA